MICYTLNKMGLLVLMLMISAGIAFTQSSKKIIFDVQWSPDGNYVAFAGGEFSCEAHASANIIEVMHVATGQIVQELQGHTCDVLSLAWHPDRSQLLSSGNDNRYILWDINTGQQVYSISNNFPGGIGSLSWSPDGTKFASIDYLTGLVFVRHRQNGAQITMPVEFKGHIYDRRNTIAWSPDGQQIATGNNDDGTIRIWSAAGILLLTNNTHADTIVSLAWSPDGNHLASTGLDKSVSVWNVSTQQVEWTIPLNQNVNVIEWSPDGDFLAVGTQQSGIYIYQSTGEQVADIPYAGPVYAVDWNNDGTKLAYGGKPLDGQIAELEVVSPPTTCTANEMTDEVTRKATIAPANATSTASIATQYPDDTCHTQ